MTRLLSTSLLSCAISVALAGCLVGDPDALRRNNENGGGADASPAGGPDAAPVVGGPDAAPGAPDAEPVPTQQSTLEDFGRCMLLADWQAANLDQLGLALTNADGNCATCHAGGLSGTYLGLDGTANFEQAKLFPYVLRYAKADALLALTVSQDLVLAGQQAGHPPYTLPANLIAGITQFFDATHARYELNAGNCPPGL